MQLKGRGICGVSAQQSTAKADLSLVGHKVMESQLLCTRKKSGFGGEDWLSEKGEGPGERRDLRNSIRIGLRVNTVSRTVPRAGITDGLSQQWHLLSLC